MSTPTIDRSIEEPPTLLDPSQHASITNPAFRAALRKKNRKLDATARAALLSGQGGRVPSPQKRATNERGASVIDTVIQNRE